MPVSPYLSLARAAGYRDELNALRAELRCILQHPAILPARRQAAEPLMCQCTEPDRLRHWLALAVAECGRWEELKLAAESRQKALKEPSIGLGRA